MAALNTDYDYLFKILVVGNSGVGKSCLYRRFVTNEYTDSAISTIGVDFMVKNVKLQDKVIKLHLWDTAGQERFRCIVSSYYSGAHGVMLVYDTTRPESLEDIRTRWLPEARLRAPRDATFMLVGNKSDLDNDSWPSHDTDVREFCVSNDLQLALVSAKTGKGIDVAFETMALKFLEKKRTRLTPDAATNSATVDLRAEPLKTSACCGGLFS